MSETPVDSNSTSHAYTPRQRLIRVGRLNDSYRFHVLGLPVKLITSKTPVLGKYLKAKEEEYSFRNSGTDNRTLVGSPNVAGRPVITADTIDHPYYLKPEREERRSVEDLVNDLAEYDVVSFDIFDTALQRTVENPNDVFRILGHREGIDNFTRRRKASESHARTINYRAAGTREVTLSEIYAVMTERYNIDPAVADRECALEIEVSRANPYIKQVYDSLRARGVTIVFMSDMYLPLSTIGRMLEKNGYDGYENIYLSNMHAKRKGDGTLQFVLRADYGPEARIAHVGDVYDADVRKSEPAGIVGFFNPDQRAFVKENDMGSLAGSFYGAVINNTMGSGTWNEGMHYSHGFRVGGILALGYCEFLEELAARKGIQKILFSGRDCDVISRAYQMFYGSTESAYIDVSRYALLGVTLEQNFEEYIDRSFFRWLNDSNNSRTIGQILSDTGFGYLIPALEEADIEPYLFPRAGDQNTLRRRLEAFFWSHRELIVEHNETSVQAAKDYFRHVIGDARRILVADVGWAGTGAMVLREFLTREFPDVGFEVSGAVMCASRTEEVTDAVAFGLLDAYVHSALENMDLTRFMMPWGRRPVRETDLLHHPLEYLFTEDAATVTGYGFDADGQPQALRGNNRPHNAAQIHAIQKGILDFIEKYLDYSRGCREARKVSGYVAFHPLKRAIEHPDYSYLVYKDFLYDAAPTLFSDAAHYEDFGSLYEAVDLRPIDTRVKSTSATPAYETPSRGKILFVSPEMTYMGAPHSLLRLSRVASSLGYEPIIWTAKAGSFAREFELHGFPVEVVDPRHIDDRRIRALIAADVRLAVCNTVVTDAYVQRLEGRIPVVWYVREATNLPDFLRSDLDRANTLRNSTSICCVSDYAAEAIRQFADGPIEVVHNSVEDVSTSAPSYNYSQNRKHRFLQLGTIEQRKGYDVLIAAFQSMPSTYRERAELHFAGAFISSGSSFASYVFGQAQNDNDIHFHGLITDPQKKIELLSQTDTVVVASRDESCSLVALEGAMLSKPLIVTHNVGAKYMVNGRNGFVVDTGDVASLREAMMAMIDADDATIAEMGSASREMYMARASMETHRSDLEALFERRIAAGPTKRLAARREVPATAADHVRGGLIVSFTSYPERMPTISACVDSLLAQTLQPDEIILWLSTEQFPGREADLPVDLLDRVGELFRIAWVDGDLGPHKKYFYAMQKYPNACIVTVDDDAIYAKDLLANLYESHLKQPHAVVCDRANLMLFKSDGRVRSYDGWIYNYGALRDTLTYQLLPVGVGGVLYPPHAVPAAAFDTSAILRTSLFADDLWLKVMTSANGYPAIMPPRRAGYTLIEESQVTGLWRANAFRNKNDVALELILDHFDRVVGPSATLLRRFWGVGDDRTFYGPRANSFSSFLRGGHKLDETAL